MDDFISTREAAELLGVGPTAVKRWADAGELACQKTAGGHRRFRRADVLGLVNAPKDELSGAQRPGNARAEEWIDALGQANTIYRPESMLLSDRAALGSWCRVADFLGSLLDEVGRRWRDGKLTIRHEHLLSERLRRTLANASLLLPVAHDAPEALLVSVPTDEHTLGLSLVELCLREAGWQSRWSGQNTPISEVVAAVDCGEVQMVAASASVSVGDEKLLQDWIDEVGATCRANEVDLLLGGRAPWPDEPSYGLRLRDFADLRAFLVGGGTPPARRRGDRTVRRSKVLAERTSSTGSGALRSPLRERG